MKLTIAKKRGDKTIAQSLAEGSDLFINIEDDSGDSLDTSPEIKLQIFKGYLKQNPKLSMKDINEMIDAFEKGEKIHPNVKLDRKYDDALQFVEESLRKFLTYPEEAKLFPLVNKDKSFSLYVSGMRASGKSYFVREFIKHNRPAKTEVIVISPFEDDDPSLKGINYIKFNLDEIEEQLEREFTIFDFPEDAIVVFDDLEGFDKRTQKRVDDLRDKALTIGRHHGKRGLSVICINHNPMEGQRTKQSLRESAYFCVFPGTNPRDTKALLKTYAGYSDAQITEVLNTKSRFVFLSKTIPSYWVSSTQVRLNAK